MVLSWRCREGTVMAPATLAPASTTAACIKDDTTALATMCSRPRVPSNYAVTWDAAVASLRLTTSLFDVADCVTLTEASPLATSPAAQSPLVAGISTQACGKRQIPPTRTSNRTRRS